MPMTHIFTYDMNPYEVMVCIVAPISGISRHIYHTVPMTHTFTYFMNPYSSHCLHSSAHQRHFPPHRSSQNACFGVSNVTGLIHMVPYLHISRSHGTVWLRHVTQSLLQRISSHTMAAKTPVLVCDRTHSHSVMAHIYIYVCVMALCEWDMSHKVCYSAFLATPWRPKRLFSWIQYDRTHSHSVMAHIYIYLGVMALCEWDMSQKSLSQRISSYIMAAKRPVFVFSSRQSWLR